MRSRSTISALSSGVGSSRRWQRASTRRTTAARDDMILLCRCQPPSVCCRCSSVSPTPTFWSDACHSARPTPTSRSEGSLRDEGHSGDRRSTRHHPVQLWWLSAHRCSEHDCAELVDQPTGWLCWLCCPTRLQASTTGNRGSQGSYEDEPEAAEEVVAEREAHLYSTGGR